MFARASFSRSARSCVVTTAALAGGAALAVSTPDPLPAQQPATVRLPGDAVAIYNLAGRAEIVPGTGNAVTVRIDPAGPDADQLRHETGEIDGRQTLRVLYPDDRIVYPDSRTEEVTICVADDGRFHDPSCDGLDWLPFVGGDEVTLARSGDGTEAHADLRIEVPPGTSLALYLGVGEAIAAGVEADLEIDARAAAIRTEGTRGSLELDIGAGAVDVLDAEGNVLVDTGSGSVTIRGVAGGLEVDTGSGSIEAQGVRGRDILLDTGSGGITASDIRVSGEMELDTGSGSVELRSVQADELLVDTGSGEVSGAGITVSDLEIDTGSGSVELADVGAEDFMIDTGSGEVRLALTSDVDEGVVDTGSGGVTLLIPESLGAELVADVGSGGIEIDVPARDVRSDEGGDWFRGTIGDGQGRIEVDTGSGGLRVQAR